MIRSILVLNVLLLSSVSSPSVRAADCVASVPLVTELGVRIADPTRFPLSRNITAYPLHPQQMARYIRVKIDLEGTATAGGCSWLLTVRDDQYRVIQTIGPGWFMKSRSKWTLKIPSTTAIFELQRCPDGSGPAIKFSEFIAMPSQALSTYYSSQTSVPSFEPLYSADTALRGFGDFVGMFMSSRESISWVCSGVMVAKDLFLTNWHCGGPEWVQNQQTKIWEALPDEKYWSGEIISDAIIDMSFDTDQISREYAATGIVAKDKNLDFSLLRVESLNAVGPARSVKLRLDSIRKDEPVLLVHHPAGAQKQITNNCNIADAEYVGWKKNDKTEFTHRCDSEVGSSGAPILDIHGNLVGLHHLGFLINPDTCESDKLNKAIRIDKIMGFLQENYPEIAAELKAQ